VKHPTSFAALVAVGALVTCPAPSATRMTAQHAAAIRDSVQTTLDAMRRYSAAGQWDSLSGLYANDPDFRWMEQGVVQYRSPTQIREALARVSRTTRIETSYFDTRILALAPGVAAVTTTFHTEFVNEGRPAVEFGGVLDVVFVHREGGWRILLGHSSSRTPTR